LAAAAERRLNHPVAQAIVRGALEARIAIPSRHSSAYTIGLGVTAQVNGCVVHTGCIRFLKKLAIPIPPRAKQDLDAFAQKGVSSVCVAVDGTFSGLIGYTDQTRPEAAGVIDRLRGMGIREILMLTGDQDQVAGAVARALSIPRYVADILPAQKMEVVNELKRRGYCVAVVGDGINDSPALAHADVGIAVSGGADLAQETAQVVLLNGDLQHLPLAIALARDAMTLIHDNWRIIAIPNTVALALACCGMVGAGAATVLSNGSAIIATGHALRPRWHRGSSEESYNGPLQ
jgi:Cu2+-exporting ATPase